MSKLVLLDCTLVHPCTLAKSDYRNILEKDYCREGTWHHIGCDFGATKLLGWRYSSQRCPMSFAE